MDWVWWWLPSLVWDLVTQGSVWTGCGDTGLSLDWVWWHRAQFGLGLVAQGHQLWVVPRSQARLAHGKRHRENSPDPHCGSWSMAEATNTISN